MSQPTPTPAAILQLSAPPSAGTPRGFVLAGTHGSSGKTVLTCLLLAGLQARGLAVQPFKAGPDYIDPSFHNRYSLRPSRNLDTWLMGTEAVREEARVHTTGATGILEGVLGLFDGASPTSDEGSTLELARELGWPIVLSLPAAKAGRSISATLRGFLAEAHPHTVAGVVLNGISGDSHAAYLKEALAPLGVPVLGTVPQLGALQWPERYLGLQAAQERALPTPEELAALAHAHLDLSAFAALAATHPAAPAPASAPTTEAPRTRGARKRIAIARDEAFHFYYQASLDWLEAQGAELVTFSPLRDEFLPRGTTSLLLGGGFPEVYAKALSENRRLFYELRRALADGLPCYAECGGLMLLAEKLVTADGEVFPMVGAVPGAVQMTGALQNFGYCSATAADGSTHRGHEFHYSRWSGEAQRANAWRVERRRDGSVRQEGFRTPTLHASYVHLHFPGNAPTLRAQLALDL